jgi:NhaP-type Na+/H+ or K+/H+ antiporter
LTFAHRLIDHESFLSFGIALTFFTLGVVGILGSDDILCCFIVGNAFTWDDWFRVQTEDHAFQDVIDQLLNTVSGFSTPRATQALTRR